MNQISEKELSALNDLLTGEELLIKKFQVLADNCPFPVFSVKLKGKKP